jgi:hypothetical protein
MSLRRQKEPVPGNLSEPGRAWARARTALEGYRQQGRQTADIGHVLALLDLDDAVWGPAWQEASERLANPGADPLTGCLPV